nr:hypothetical protein [Tanacetum cinerariifolium]
MHAEESRSKMIEKQNDPQMIEKKVITKPIDYPILNQLSTDFNTRFVPQTESYAEQAFWSQYSVQTDEPTHSQCLIDEVTEVQNIFKQMELAVEQHCAGKTKSQTKMENVLKENDRLLTQALSVEIVNIVERKVEREVEEIETLNLELDHKVTKLAAENKHLKQTYKQLFDSIKSSRVRSKEHCDDLINKVNLKSVEVADLNASLQEKVLVITALKDQLSKLKGKAEKYLVNTALKNDLRKLKGKSIINDVVTLHTIAPKMLKVNVEPLALKLLNNRTTHSEYLRHTQEQAMIFKEVVKEGKSKIHSIIP